MSKILIFIAIILVLGLIVFLFFDLKKEEGDITKIPEKIEEKQESLLGESEKMVSITTIYDNYLPSKNLEEAKSLGLKNDWGFSCLINTGNEKILFDTGADGKILIENMKKLNINPESINLVVISHDHYDHYGGLSDFLEQNNKVKVYIPSSLHRTREVAKNAGAEIFETDNPTKITENAYTTGRLGTTIEEQSLVIKTKKGLVIITGCSHPGIINIIESVKKQFVHEKIHLVLGGFHLFQKNVSELENIVNSFRELEVQKVAPCHCSGDQARKLFKEEYGDDFIENGVSKVINIEQ